MGASQQACCACAGSEANIQQEQKAQATDPGLGADAIPEKLPPLPGNNVIRPPAEIAGASNEKAKLVDKPRPTGARQIKPNTSEEAIIDVKPVLPETDDREEASAPTIQDATEEVEEKAKLVDKPRPTASAPTKQDATEEVEGTSGNEFFITLDKSSGKPLGMTISFYEPADEGESLLIEHVTGGLTERWNETHSNQPVCSGDRMVEVNGIKGEVNRMVEECKKNQVLHVRVRKA